MDLDSLEKQLLIDNLFYITYILSQKTSFSALHAAAVSGNVECARSILEAGADADALDDKNTHAAHL